MRQAECAKIKTSLIVDQKKYFPKKGNFKKKLRELKGHSECAFSVSDQEYIKTGSMAPILDDL